MSLTEGRSNCSGVKSRAFLDCEESGTNILKICYDKENSSIRVIIFVMIDV